MKNGIYPVAAGLFTLLVSSCATLNKEECITADWYAIGHEDASYGREANYLSQHRKACAEHGVTPNFERYNQGHSQGLTVFCRSNRGYTMASDGSSYPEVCDRSRFPEFVDAFAKGEKVYVARRAVWDVEEDLREAERRLEDVLSEIKRNEDTIVAGATTPEIRRELIEKNKELEASLEPLRTDIEEIEAVLQQRRQALKLVE